MKLLGRGVLGIGLIVICFVLCFSVIKTYAVEPGFYLRAGGGYSWSRDADFSEDNPAVDPFLYIVFPSAVGGDVLDDVGDSPILGGGFGYRFCESFRADFTVSTRWKYELDEWDKAGTKYEADLKSTAYMVNGYYDIPLDLGRFRPFIGAGIGVAKNKLDKLDWWDGPGSEGKIPGGTNRDFAWQLMAGTAIEISDRCAVEIGYRYYDAGEFEKDSGWDNTGTWYTGSADGDLRAHEAMLEFVFYFGGEKAVAAEPPKDSDGDGVTDDLDQCPGTPRGVKVDATGCPLDSDGDGVPDHKDKCPDTPRGVKVDATGCPLDSDGDGVPDYLDKCPKTPEGVKVDATGCPLDSDGDGVPDYLDECPDTPKGATVDERGCWAFGGRVFFDTNKSEIKTDAIPLLAEAINIMKENPEMRVEIQGHTDSTGPDAYNQGLSERRANSIKEYLVSKGIDSGQLEVRGYGESDPIASNETLEGRQKNRRVRFKRIP